MSKNIHKCVGSQIMLPVDPDGTLPTEIEIMPTGVVQYADGRPSGRVTDPQSLIATSLASAAGNVLFVDFDHGVDGFGTGDGRAAGWITSLRVQGDRILGAVEWTPLGAQALRDKTYRFFSPSFWQDKKTGEITRIDGGGLVNQPALPQLKQVASTQKDPEMDPILEIAQALGLNAETDGDRIVASVQALIAGQSGAAKIVAAAGLDGDLDDTKATAIITKMTAAKPADPDPAKFVPMAVFGDLQKQVATLTNTAHEAAVDRAITSAKAAGKLTPAMEAWGRQLASSDMQAFEAFVAAQPKVLTPGSLLSGQPDPEAGVLAAAEKQVCAMTGISEEAFLATKQGKMPAKKER